MPRSIATAILCAAVVGVPAAARAQTNVIFIPSMSFTSVYDDNLFARRQSDAGQMALVRPAFDGTYESTRLKLQGTGSFDMVKSNFSTLDSLNARRNLFVQSTYRTTEMTSLGLSGSYDASDTPGELNFETGILSDRLHAQRVQVTPSLIHRLDEMRTVSGSFDYITETMDGFIGDGLQVARLNYATRRTTRDTVTYGLMTRRFTDVIGDEWSAAALYGWTRQLAYGTTVTVQGGPRVTSYNGVRPEFLTNFIRNTNRVHVLVDYWHGETLILGIHGPVRLDTASSRITWPFSRTIDFGIHGGVSDIATLDDRQATIYRTSLVGSWSPGGIYTITGSWGLDFQQGQVRRDLLNDPEVVRHVFRIGLTVAPRISHIVEPTGNNGPAARQGR